MKFDGNLLPFFLDQSMISSSVQEKYVSFNLLLEFIYLLNLRIYLLIESLCFSYKSKYYPSSICCLFFFIFFYFRFLLFILSVSLVYFMLL
jgi:hypothetical protein